MAIAMSSASANGLMWAVVSFTTTTATTIKSHLYFATAGGGLFGSPYKRMPTAPG